MAINQSALRGAIGALGGEREGMPSHDEVGGGVSEASSEFRPASSATPRRLDVRRRRGVRADRRTPASSLSDGERAFPLDPPLPDVRIPVKAPHATATAYSRAALMHRFPNAQVGDDLHMLFSEPGKEGQSRLSPDVFVALKVPRHRTRADYDADRLGPPNFVLEVLSASTWKHDLGRKLDAYQRIGVRECLLFDATGEDRARTNKELWGFALTPESRDPLPEKRLANGESGVVSAVLGLVAYVAERVPPAASGETWALTMRWHDPATGADIPDYDQSRAGEAQALAREAQAVAQAQAERARAEAAHRRIAEMQEELRRLRGRR